MFQSFESRQPRGDSAKRVARLRARMVEEGLTGYLVSHADEHQSEYLPASAERLAWLTNFSGSAGAAIVMREWAAVFVDGRYTLQAASEVDAGTFEIADLVENPPARWLATHATAGERIGFDPKLVTIAERELLAKRLEGTEARLVALKDNLIDSIWDDRPSPPIGEVAIQSNRYAGRTVGEKLADLADVLVSHKADAAVLTLADSVAWAFNIRGSDVAHNPVPLGYAIVSAAGRPTLYLDARKLSNSVRAELADFADIAEPHRLAADVQALAGSGKAIALDPASAPVSLADAIDEAGGRIVRRSDPTALVKSRKNPAELTGARRAHHRDGVAMVRFLAWLDREAPSGTLDEISAVEALERFRAATAEEDGEPLAEIAFDTIAGAGPNGAIVHYRVTRETNRPLDQDSLFLIDSGGQYRDGTTDITRTVAIGTPSDEMRVRYTLVLQGMIALSEARFPAGTTGTQLDTFARAPLWRAGLDYDHGTGHGVGSFLSVHEGPARIAKTANVNLEPSMILSNEPGYYKAGAYGIRIENLVIVTEPRPIEGGERKMLGFETLTIVPLDRRLIDTDMLSESERRWIDGYHARIRDVLGPRLAADDFAWLEATTAKLGR